MEESGRRPVMVETIPEEDSPSETETQAHQPNKQTNDKTQRDSKQLTCNDLKLSGSESSRRRSSSSHASSVLLQKAGDLSRRLSRNIELTHHALVQKASIDRDPDAYSLVAYYEKKTNNEQPDRDLDGGYALVVLAAMFAINASTFGTARAYGLIFEKSARDDATSRMEAAIPFTIMGALENMSGPLAGYILTKFQSWRLTVVLGSALVASAHLSAAYFDSLAGRIATMGIVCGFGTSLITISSFQINNAYFDKYRSMAFGFGLTGAAFGTLYISPLCRFVLDTYSTNACFVLLGLILLPNIGLALLLRPKFQAYVRSNPASKRPSIYSIASVPVSQLSRDSRRSSKKSSISTIAGDLQKRIQIQSHNVRLCYSIKRVLCEPLFHLIWPTQLIFCWLNFVIGMIVVDYARDRGLTETELGYLIPVWALGQLIGRLVLGAVVDMKFVSYKTFTVICLGSIAMSLWSLGNVRNVFASEGTLVIVLILILSLFIANLYILFNGLIAHYIDSELTAMSIGISSFISSFFLLPRAHVIGYYRDTFGNYDAMLDLFTYVSAGAALVWLLAPFLIRYCQLVLSESRERSSRLQSIINQNPWLLAPNSKLHGNENKSINLDNHQIKREDAKNNITIIISDSAPSRGPTSV